MFVVFESYTRGTCCIAVWFNAFLFFHNPSKTAELTLAHLLTEIQKSFRNGTWYFGSSSNSSERKLRIYWTERSRLIICLKFLKNKGYESFWVLSFGYELSPIFHNSNCQSKVLIGPLLIELFQIIAFDDLSAVFCENQFILNHAECCKREIETSKTRTRVTMVFATTENS